MVRPIDFNSRSGGSAAANSTHSIRYQSNADELQQTVSSLALENEELKFELGQLREENAQLYQSIQEKELIQEQMRSQLEVVTKTAYTLYEKFRAFKCRYYEERRNNAWFCSTPSAAAGTHTH